MRAMKKLAAVAAVALSLTFAATAHAESKSWAAVKGSIHGKANIVMGGNLAAARSTKVFSSALQMMLSEEEDAKRAFEMIKTGCNIDVPAAIADFTVVMRDGDDPLVVLALDGLDEAKLVGCVETLAAKELGKAVKLTAKKKGKITTYSVPGEKEKLYFAWLAKDVLAFSEDPTAKGKLEKLLAGKAAKGALGKYLGKVNSDHALWAGVSMKEKEDGLTILGGYGSVDLAAGKWNGTAHIVMGSDKDANTAAAMGNQGLGEIRTKAKGTSVSAMINSLVLAAVGAELEVKATLADADLTQLVTDFDKIF